jgi:hypothetical protein
VATRRARVVHALKRTAPPSATNQSAARAATGVRTAESRGKIAVKAAASAKSARAMRAKTGTTGANGEAASKTIATATSLSSRPALAAKTASAGTTTKFNSTIALNRQQTRADFT